MFGACCDLMRVCAVAGGTMTFAAGLARARSRTTPCVGSRTRTAVSSAARSSLASVIASRRLACTRSLSRFGMSDVAGDSDA